VNGSERLVIHTDGAARGNPGPAGAGAVLRRASGELVEEASRYLGRATNNVAEYGALILALERAREHGAREIEIRADSELLVRQMSGEYKIKNEALKELAARAHEIARSFERVAYVHVRREYNRDADRLANRAIDEAGSA
jgi:ribonuclease HI